MNNGKICVSICAETADELIGKIKRADKIADVIEVRFDCLSQDEIESARVLISKAEILKPLVATFRPREQGGQNHHSFDKRQEFWRKALNGNWFADVEDDVFNEAVDWNGRIASVHRFDGVPANLVEIFQRLSLSAAVAVKIAVSVEDVSDAIPVWDLLEPARAVGKQIIPIAMGETGKWTRILGLAHGAFMTYAALDPGTETAAGQLTAKDLIEVYRVKELDRETRVYGVIGDPVSGSLSPYIHNAAFAAASINAVFIPLQVKDLDEFIRRMVRKESREVELNFGGFAVTMPHKQTIMRHLDDIEPAAEKIGAVNTVKIDGDRMTGYNTDAYGFIEPLKSKFSDLKGSRVAVLGAGGAARACIFALQQENADVTVFARDEERSAALGRDFGISSSGLSKIKDQSFKVLSNDFDIVVNATPMGMNGPFADQTPLTAEQLEGVKFVFDIVTSAGDTPLIKEARKAGVSTISGEEMLLYQGAKQFEIWTGRSAPIEIMREALANKQKETRR